MAALEAFPWGEFGVSFAVLFGSRSRGGVGGRDWDLAVYFKGARRDLELLEALARHLGVSEDLVDLVVLNDYEELPCTLVREVLCKGRVVYRRSLEEYVEESLRMLNICLDFAIDAEKLELLKTQLEAVKKQWA